MERRGNLARRGGAVNAQKPPTFVTIPPASPGFGDRATSRWVRTPSPAGLLAALLFGTALLGAPSPASAYEDQATLFVDLGYGAALANDALPTHGAQLGLGGSWGLNDAWTLRGRLSYAAHPADRPMHVAMAGVEVFYLLDIVQLVPFFGVGIDGLATVTDLGAGSVFDVDLALHAIVGLDYLVNRRVVVGVDVRPYILPLAFDAETLAPVYLSASVRLSIVFERY